MMQEEFDVLEKAMNSILNAELDRLREELADTVNQVKLAQKGYDYEGACEAARHYKEMTNRYKTELGAYRLWAEVEIADLRDDVKRLLGELAAIKGSAT